MLKVKGNKCFLEFQLMYLILDANNYERPNDNVVAFLSDANPYMRNGECSVDIVLYEDFKDKYEKYNNHEDYSYEFICSYLKNIEYYKDIYETFILVSKEEYIDDCNEILNNRIDLIKNIS